MSLVSHASWECSDYSQRSERFILWNLINMNSRGNQKNVDIITLTVA